MGYEASIGNICCRYPYETMVRIHSNKCQRCGSTKEDIHHALIYKGGGVYELWNEGLLDLEKLLVN